MKPDLGWGGDSETPLEELFLPFPANHFLVRSGTFCPLPFLTAGVLSLLTLWSLWVHTVSPAACLEDDLGVTVTSGSNNLSTHLCIAPEPGGEGVDEDSPLGNELSEVLTLCIVQLWSLC